MLYIERSQLLKLDLSFQSTLLNAGRICAVLISNIVCSSQKKCFTSKIKIYTSSYLCYYNCDGYFPPMFFSAGVHALAVDPTRKNSWALSVHQSEDSRALVSHLATARLFYPLDNSQMAVSLLCLGTPRVFDHADL